MSVFKTYRVATSAKEEVTGRQASWGHLRSVFQISFGLADSIRVAEANFPRPAGRVAPTEQNRLPYGTLGLTWTGGDLRKSLKIEISVNLGVPSFLICRGLETSASINDSSDSQADNAQMNVIHREKRRRCNEIVRAIHRRPVSQSRQRRKYRSIHPLPRSKPHVLLASQISN